MASVHTIANFYNGITSTLLLDVTLLLLTVVMTTVRLMRGSATESRLLPVTVTSVPPL